MPVNVSLSTRNWRTREGSSGGYSQPIDSSVVPGTPKANAPNDHEPDHARELERMGPLRVTPIDLGVAVLSDS